MDDTRQYISSLHNYSNWLARRTSQLHSLHEIPQPAPPSAQIPQELPTAQLLPELFETTPFGRSLTPEQKENYFQRVVTLQHSILEQQQDRMQQQQEMLEKMRRRPDSSSAISPLTAVYADTQAQLSLSSASVQASLSSSSSSSAAAAAVEKEIIFINFDENSMRPTKKDKDKTPVSAPVDSSSNSSSSNNNSDSNSNTDDLPPQQLSIEQRLLNHTSTKPSTTTSTSSRNNFPFPTPDLFDPFSPSSLDQTFTGPDFDASGTINSSDDIFAALDEEQAPSFSYDLEYQPSTYRQPIKPQHTTSIAPFSHSLSSASTAAAPSPLPSSRAHQPALTEPLFIAHTFPQPAPQLRPRATRTRNKRQRSALLSSGTETAAEPETPAASSNRIGPAPTSTSSHHDTTKHKAVVDSTPATNPSPTKPDDMNEAEDEDEGFEEDSEYSYSYSDGASYSDDLSESEPASKRPQPYPDHDDDDDDRPAKRLRTTDSTRSRARVEGGVGERVKDAVMTAAVAIGTVSVGVGLAWFLVG